MTYGQKVIKVFAIILASFIILNMCFLAYAIIEFFTDIFGDKYVTPINEEKYQTTYNSVDYFYDA